MMTKEEGLAILAKDPEKEKLYRALFGVELVDGMIMAYMHNGNVSIDIRRELCSVEEFVTIHSLRELFEMIVDATNNQDDVCYGLSPNISEGVDDE